VERFGAEMQILHVSGKRSAGAPEPGALEFPADEDQPQHELPSWVAGFVERVRHLCGVSAPAGLRFHWTQGDPGPEILEFARRNRIDLITLAWHGHLEHGHARIVHQVLRDAPCPILLLPCGPL
jgi:hypothetical protein